MFFNNKTHLHKLFYRLSEDTSCMEKITPDMVIEAINTIFN